MRGLLQRLVDLVRMLLMGRVGRVGRAALHRLYSNSVSVGLRRDVSIAFSAPAAKRALEVRPLETGDDLVWLDVRQSGLTDGQVFERLGQLRIIQSGLRTCYVAVGPDGKPCYMQWLIGAGENERLREFFGNLYPALRADEALLEGAYTREADRGQGIMACAMAQIAARAVESGVRWVITFVDETNLPSLKGCERAGFRPYVRRVETYRFLRRRVAFVPTPLEAPQVEQTIKAGARAFACVLGDTDLLRALRLARIPSVVAAQPGEPARYSRLARVSLDWADPETLSGTLVGILERFAAAVPQPPVLFYDEDRYVLFVSRQRERLKHQFRFVIPAAALVENLVDKFRFQTLAERLDLPVPAGWLLDPLVDAPPRDLRFPLAVKPRWRDDQWPALGGDAKALQVDSPAALRELWPRLAAAGVPVLVQQLIPGPETQVESYHVYVDDRGAIVGEFTGRKLRTWPPAHGFSTALVTSDAPDVLSLGRDIVARLELRGVAKIDFKRAPAPDGRLYLLEVNPRFSLWHHLGARAGVNIPALVYADLVGESRPRTGTARAGVRWSKPWHDLLAARADGLPLLAWLGWTLGAEAKRAVAWDDPWPLFGALLNRSMSRLRHRLPTAPAQTQPAASAGPGSST